jgi:anti-sigma regulatory factor (Ser/Thr protein kinase)
MSAAHRSANGGALSGRALRFDPGGNPAAETPSDRTQVAAVEGLTVALGRLRKGAAALKAENHQLRAEIAGFQSPAAARPESAEASRELGLLAEVVLPADAAAPGAARMVIAHCLSGLVARRILGDAQLLGTELVTNSLQHAELRGGDPVFVRIYLGAEALRLEVENPGTAGVVAAKVPDRRSGAGGFGLDLVGQLAERWGVSRTHSTIVWLELGRA